MLQSSMLCIIQLQLQLCTYEYTYTYAYAMEYMIIENKTISNTQVQVQNHHNTKHQYQYPPAGTDLASQFHTLNAQQNILGPELENVDAKQERQWYKLGLSDYGYCLKPLLNSKPYTCQQPNNGGKLANFPKPKGKKYQFNACLLNNIDSYRQSAKENSTQFSSINANSFFNGPNACFIGEKLRQSGSKNKDNKYRCQSHKEKIKCYKQIIKVNMNQIREVKKIKQNHLTQKWSDIFDCIKRQVKKIESLHKQSNCNELQSKNNKRNRLMTLAKIKATKKIITKMLEAEKIQANHLIQVLNLRQLLKDKDNCLGFCYKQQEKRKGIKNSLNLFKTESLIQWICWIMRNENRKIKINSRTQMKISKNSPQNTLKQFFTSQNGIRKQIAKKAVENNEKQKSDSEQQNSSKQTGQVITQAHFDSIHKQVGVQNEADVQTNKQVHILDLNKQQISRTIQNYVYSEEEMYRYYPHSRQSISTSVKNNEGSPQLPDCQNINEIRQRVKKNRNINERIHSKDTDVYRYRYALDCRNKHYINKINKTNMTNSFNALLDAGGLHYHDIQEMDQICSSHQFESDQLIKFQQIGLEHSHRKNQSNLEDLINQTLNTMTVQINQAKHNRQKINRRNKIFNTYHFNGLNNSSLNKYFKFNSHHDSNKPSKQGNREEQLKKACRSYLRKGKSRYAVIFDQINASKLSKLKYLVKNPAEVVNQSLSQSKTDLAQKQNISNDLTVKLLTQTSLNKLASGDIQYNRSNLDSSLVSQNEHQVKFTDEEIQNIIKNNKFLFEGDKQNDFMAEQEKVLHTRKKLIKHNKKLSKNRVLRSSLNKTLTELILDENNFQGARQIGKRNVKTLQNQPNQQTKQKNGAKYKNLPSGSSYMKESLKRETQINGSQKLIKRSKNSKHYVLVNKNTKESMELRAKQDNLLNQFYKNHSMDEALKKQKDASNGQSIITANQKVQQQLLNDYKIEQQKKQALLSKLKHLRHQFHSMLANKIDLEGPSVFCRLVENKKNRYIACQQNQNELQASLRMKKPYYLNNAQSKKYNNADKVNQFKQNSLEIDFSKHFSKEISKLGQIELGKIVNQSIQIQ